MKILIVYFEPKMNGSLQATKCNEKKL